MINLRCQT